MSNSNKLVAIDADGVMADYNSAYASLWERAFGVKPVLSRPDGYHAIDRYGLPRLDPDALSYFEGLRNEEFWATVPIIPGAREACEALRARGFTLVCVTALHPRFSAARAQCLEPLGFTHKDIFATSVTSALQGVSPKASVLEALAPRYFVDDYFPYFQGVASGIRRVLVHRDTYNSPNNTESAMHETDIQVASLLEFSRLKRL